MSLRRDYCTDETVGAGRLLGGAFAESAAQNAPATISSSLGLDDSGPAHPYVRFEPQHPTPQPVGNVVDDAFVHHVAAPTGLFGKKKKGPAVAVKGAPKKGSMMGNLKAAKSKADEAVRKGKKMASAGKAAAGKAMASAKLAAKATSDSMVGLGDFDYKVYSSAFSAVLGVAKKEGGEPRGENSFQPFAEGWYAQEQVSQVAAAQAQKMKRTESKVLVQKGRDSKKITKPIPGRNAACLGFARVEASDETNSRFGDAIFRNTGKEVAGIPTLVNIDATNGDESMVPITGLVLEALNTDDIPTNDEGKIDFEFASIDEIDGENAFTGSMTPDETAFKFVGCVHGVHVDANKALHVGPKILVPASEGAKKRSDDAMEDLRGYGIVTENGVESALAHAIRGEKIDMLLLWTSWKLALGAKRLANSKLGKADKSAVAEIFGSADGPSTKNTINESVDADEFAELTLTHIA